MKKTERMIKALTALIAEKGFEGIYENPKNVYLYLREKKAAVSFLRPSRMLSSSMSDEKGRR